MSALPLEIAATDAKADITAGRLTVIDVREGWEVSTASLPNSYHLPLGQIHNALETLDKTGRYVVMCHHGVRSLQACLYLRQAGYSHVQSLKGGIHQWSLTVDASVPCY